ncbi:MAG: chorismate mutase [Magnetospirillum sp.]|nr:chorismate mutase [Magnetospirillum sp.]
MTTDNTSLDALRRDIDRIDDQLHDLLMQRTAVVAHIGALKSVGEIALRPGREADILRRLAARHQGAFPRTALSRIWREILGALVGLQQPLTIAVAQPERGAGFIELARNHFGVVWPVVTNASAGQVLKMVSDGQAGVGVVPLPGRGPGGTEPWWVALAADSSGIPKVITRLPFFPVESNAGGRTEPLEALVLAQRGHDDTGSDRTLLVLESGPQVSRDRVRAVLAAGRFEPTEVLASHNVGGTLLHLAEVEGHLKPDDLRLEMLVAAKEPIRHARIIGGYPVPLPE